VISITIPNLPRLQRGVASGPSAVDAELRSIVQTGALLIESEARSLAPRDTGRLQGSIHSRISGLTAEVGPTVAYGLFVEKGTRAHFPPVGAISGWAVRHGLNPYAVARGMSRKARPPRPFMVPALERSRARIEALAAKVGATVVLRMAG
jgi:HK97 gp10 family phage protein